MTTAIYQPKLGEVVRLKSGGPKMTVVREVGAREGFGPVWECAWFVDLKEVRTAEFSSLAIEPIE